MKKNQESDVGKASGVVWKMWLTMKLLFCFLLIGFSTVYGNAFSQVKIHSFPTRRSSDLKSVV